MGAVNVDANAGHPNDSLQSFYKIKANQINGKHTYQLKVTLSLSVPIICVVNFVVVCILTINLKDYSMVDLQYDTLN